MRKRTIMKYITVIITLLFAFALTAYADFGDYGGDADFGYDYNDNNSFDDYDYNYDDDVDYDDDNRGGGYIIRNDSSDSDNSGSSGGNGWIGFVVVFVFIVLIFGIPIIRSLLGKNKKTIVAPGALPTDVSTLRPISEYNTVDPHFSQPDFCEELSNMYVRFQNAWQAKKLDDVRPCLSDDFYAQVNRQLDTYRKNKQTNRIERISVMGVDLLGWKQEGGKDVIIARLQTRIVDYVVDDATGNVIRGSNTAEKFMTYEWNLIRTSGRQTGQSNGESASSCPNCGAPLDLNKSAKCEYCGSIIETDDFDWVLSGVKGLSQRTAG